jgi:transposase
MLSFPSAVKIFLCREHTDMRKSFDSLAVMVKSIIHQDPLSGHIFVFCNRRADRLKLLYWDRDGFAVWYKRLEKGIFSLPQASEDSCVIDHRQLMMILEGVDISSVRFKKRFFLKNF